MEITSKNQIIDYFSSGCKSDLLIGVENEKFLFREKDQQRVNYSDIKKVLNLYSEKYKWEKIFENENLIGLKLGGKSITLEPGMINIQVWDQNNVSLVDAAIKKSELGLNPQIDGQLIRLPVPELNEERRSVNVNCIILL